MWYLVLRPWTVPEEEWMPMLDEHLDWMRKQHEEAHILFSGPTSDHKTGIYVIRANSLAEAQDIAARDPFTVHGLAKFEIIEWQVHQIMGAGHFTYAEFAVREGQRKNDVSRSMSDG